MSDDWEAILASLAMIIIGAVFAFLYGSDPSGGATYAVGGYQSNSSQAGFALLLALFGVLCLIFIILSIIYKYLYKIRPLFGKMFVVAIVVLIIGAAVWLTMPEEPTAVVHDETGKLKLYVNGTNERYVVSGIKVDNLDGDLANDSYFNGLSPYKAISDYVGDMAGMDGIDLKYENEMYDLPYCLKLVFYDENSNAVCNEELREGILKVDSDYDRANDCGVQLIHYDSGVLNESIGSKVKESGCSHAELHMLVKHDFGGRNDSDYCNYDIVFPLEVSVADL